MTTPRRVVLTFPLLRFGLFEACTQFTLEQKYDWDLGNAHIGPLRYFSRVL